MYDDESDCNRSNRACVRPNRRRFPAAFIKLLQNELFHEQQTDCLLAQNLRANCNRMKTSSHSCSFTRCSYQVTKHSTLPYESSKQSTRRAAKQNFKPVIYIINSTLHKAKALFTKRAIESIVQSNLFPEVGMTV